MASFDVSDVMNSDVRETTEQSRKARVPGAANAKKKPEEKSAEERKKEIEKSVQERVIAEKRARETLLLLIEDHVSIEVLQDAAKYIDPSYYQDIVEERAIDKLCGYPICDQVLNKDQVLRNQLYQINATTNTVYDVSERKCYCSNRCYAASVLYQKQLSETPVWLRGREKVEEVRVLAPSEVRGLEGAVINLLANDPASQLAAEVKAMNLRDPESAQSSQKTPSSSILADETRKIPSINQLIDNGAVTVRESEKNGDSSGTSVTE